MENHLPLYTDRLKLRKLHYEDLPALAKYANNKIIADNIVNIPFPYREPDAAMRLSAVIQGYKTKTRFPLAIIHRDRDEFIGEISLNLMDKKSKHAQMAYWIGEPFWNQGITTEAVAEVIKFGFETLEMDLIFGDCYVDNIASEKVMTKNGMSFHTKNGNIKLFKITRESFENQKK